MSCGDYTKYPSINIVNPDSERDWSGQNSEWYIQEKIDGSQLTFCFVDNKLEFFNKGKIVKNGNKYFNKAIIMLSEMSHLLSHELIYHGEVVQKCKHSTITYERTPEFYVIIYDIQDSNGKYFHYRDIISECTRIGFEYCQVLYDNGIEKSDKSPIVISQQLISDIENGNIKSCLGGTPEGVVIKHHNFIDVNGVSHATKLKMTTTKFREEIGLKQHNTKNSENNFIEILGKNYNVEARFVKAVYRMRDQELLCDDKDENIQKIIMELDNDFEKENMEIVKNYLWSEYHDEIIKESKKNFVNWYLRNESNFVDSINIGNQYNNPDRFIRVISECNDLNPDKKKNVSKLCQLLDSDLEHHKVDIKNELWNQYGMEIKQFARHNFMEWFDNFKF